MSDSFLYLDKINDKKWDMGMSLSKYVASIKHFNALNSFQTGLPGLFFAVSLLPAANTVSTSRLLYIAKKIKCAKSSVLDSRDRHATDVMCT